MCCAYTFSFIGLTNLQSTDQTELTLCLSLVHIPDGPQRLPFRLLRTYAENHHTHVLQRFECAVRPNQPFLRCYIGHNGRSCWLAIFPCENSASVLLAVSPGRNPAQLSERNRWTRSDIQKRGRRWSIPGSGSSHCPNEFWK